MSVLDEIVAGVREDLAAREAIRPLDMVKAAAADAPAPRDAAALLREHPGTAVIAEVKRASPSKGALAGIADPTIDALVDKVMAAKSRAELVTATRAIDRVLTITGGCGIRTWVKNIATTSTSNPTIRPRSTPPAT